ncbi:MAG: cupin domain-containing protein [Chloroflexi bacterium]|nr:cupin domain-containing protein [Chloroflexota bacterium]
MGNFYDQWLNLWAEEQEERARARKCIHEEELEWVRTIQDYRAALLCARDNGFVTSGAAMLAEIPKGWSTGKHSHGEEAIFIVDGKGFSIVEGKRYDWDTGSCLFMPYGISHQHFNSGDSPVRYLSVMALALERFAGLAKVMQYEEAHEIAMGEPEGIDKADSDIHPEHGRIVLRLKDAPVQVGGEQTAETSRRDDEFNQSIAKEMRSAASGGHHGRSIALMRDPGNGFKAKEIEMTHVMCDGPGMHSGKHAHMEAVIYVLQGQGYSVVNGQKVDWKKGTLLHVQGPQTVHQHFNTGNSESQMLRIHYGLRSRFLQPIAKKVFPYLYYEFRGQSAAER